VHLDAERTELIGHELRRSRFAIAELGMLVDIAATVDDFRFDFGGGVIDALVESHGEEDSGEHSFDSSPATSSRA